MKFLVALSLFLGIGNSLLLIPTIKAEIKTEPPIQVEKARVDQPVATETEVIQDIDSKKEVTTPTPKSFSSPVPTGKMSQQDIINAKKAIDAEIKIEVDKQVAEFKAVLDKYDTPYKACENKVKSLSEKIKDRYSGNYELEQQAKRALTAAKNLTYTDDYVRSLFGNNLGSVVVDSLGEIRDCYRQMDILSKNKESELKQKFDYTPTTLGISIPSFSSKLTTKLLTESEKQLCTVRVTNEVDQVFCHTLFKVNNSFYGNW